ncbi:probable receptor-like serine/threonine-protein kinase At5g57670 [Phragmites australis]|uniref:probable receptor-like serine/threonine-protein kinase At5g57670 n=1 Tax=Phragmites australis TaxID=29695 RepID=UPI002D77438B|nr:probable receptor-like serine/threonine-protein kinase At5g57670 [Phragmites australis]
MKPLYLRSSGSLKKLLLSIGYRSAAKPTAPDADAKEAAPAPEPVSPQKPAWRCFSYDEIHRATNAFHKGNLVGRGGSSEVYRGELPDGRAVAVKRLMGASACERRERDFLAELGTVGHARHHNVCGLLGCCIDCGLYLVFEFFNRGSVSANLHDEASPAMGWAARHGIAVGTARGLEYLHKGCQRRIIHRDIKSSNVLLTEDFQPQISDFGLAKWLPSEWTHRAITPIEGTFGCLAPEYYTHGIVDEKTDVFAFGVFLLELTTGRKPVDGSHRSLLSWARPLLTDGKIDTLVDPRIGNDYDAEQARRVAFVASLCIRASAAWRPSMTEVLELLEGAEIRQDRWTMPTAADDGEDPWLFDDFNYDDDEDEGFNTPSPFSSSTTTSN